MVATTDNDALPPLDSLKCSLCDEFFTDPVTLQCLHSFCQKCFDEKVASKVPPPVEQLDANGNKLPSPPPAPVECPVCTDKLKLTPPSGYTEPFENARLARIVKLVHETNVLCQNCGECASEVKCAVCDSYLCNPCWDITHAAPVFKSHTKEALRHSEMNSLPKCPQHSVSDLEFFCTDEEIGVCQVCLLKGDFVGRAYRLVSDVRAERQSDVEAGVNTVLGLRESLVEAKEASQEVLSELNANLDTQVAAVKDNFQAIRDALNKREQETIQALGDLKTAKASVLDSQVDSIEKVLGAIDDGVRSSELVLNHSNDLELVYMTYVLQNHIRNVANVASTAPRPCAQCKKSNKSCHCPSVTPELPVQLSDRIPKLVGAYANVPSSNAVNALMPGKQLVASNQQPTLEQQQLMKEVANVAEGGDASGCTIQ